MEKNIFSTRDFRHMISETILNFQNWSKDLFTHKIKVFTFLDELDSFFFIETFPKTLPLCWLRVGTVHLYTNASLSKSIF